MSKESEKTERMEVLEHQLLEDCGYSEATLKKAVKKTIDDMSGLIDEEAALLILMKEYEKAHPLPAPTTVKVDLSAKPTKILKKTSAKPSLKVTEVAAPPETGKVMHIKRKDFSSIKSKFKSATQPLNETEWDHFQELVQSFMAGEIDGEPEFDTTSNLYMCQIPDQPKVFEMVSKFDSAISYSLSVVMMSGGFATVIVQDKTLADKYESKAGCLMACVGKIKVQDKEDLTHGKSQFRNIRARAVLFLEEDE